MKNDAEVQEFLAENPLIRFSMYTDIQSKAVIDFGRAIIRDLDGLVDADSRGDGVNGMRIPRVYGHFWLWVLGAYEIVRTMIAARQCFSAEFVLGLQPLKRKLAVIRVPFAKQERRGKSIPVGSEPSISTITWDPPDFRFDLYGEALSIRQLVEEFEATFAAVTPSDVLADHRTMYCTE